MILPVKWAEGQIGEFRTPFLRGDKERPLRITLHTQSLKEVPGEEAAAYEAIKELGQLSELDILDTAEDSPVFFRINPNPSDDGYFNLTLFQQNEPFSIHHGIHQSRVSNRMIQFLTNLIKEDDSRFQAARNHLMMAEAHCALSRDIFVTLSPWLIKKRDMLQHANIRLPTETARIAGLLLRSRDNWTYRCLGKVPYRANRGRFYWTLARSKLPELWRYFAACVQAGEFLGDEITHLGQSVLERCARALQAKDEIGKQFYLLQNNDTEDAIKYHFDYLNLLLVGVFDAQAHIANMVYGLVNDEIEIGFRKKTFRKELQKSNAQKLNGVITGERCGQLMVMLHNLRNTIHSASLASYSRLTPPNPASTFIEVPKGIRDNLWKASLVLSKPEDWGLERREYISIDSRSGHETPEVNISLEPFTYATQLISECFSLFNEIAAATQVENLFAGRDMPSLTNAPPDEWTKDMERFSILGG